MERLRHVRLHAPSGAYTLETWDGGPSSPFGRQYVGYCLRNPQGEPLFDTTLNSAPMGVSPLCAIDSDESLRDLLGFLTLRPGDTDSDYFEEYTPEQMAFAESYDCECLGLYCCDATDEYPNPPFEETP